jgi:uncharacterized protein (DUF2249 family)
MKIKTITLDVREDIRRGCEPLGPQQELLLLAPFEPVPLFGVLEKQGFRHRAEQTASGDWEVRFTRGTPSGARDAGRGLTEPQPSACGMVQDVDARGLEPPQPMVKILEALASLPAGAELRARTDRRPMHLYAQLETRGFIAQTEEESDGSFLTHIRRR